MSKTLTPAQEVTLIAMTAEACRDMPALAKAYSPRMGRNVADACALAMGQIVNAHNFARGFEILSNIAYSCRVITVWTRYCAFVEARADLGA